MKYFKTQNSHNRKHRRYNGIKLAYGKIGIKVWYFLRDFDKREQKMAVVFFNGSVRFFQ